MNKEKEYEVQIKEFQVKLSKPVFKILAIYPAINDTFAIVGMSIQGKDFLVHCDKNGNILYEYKFQHNVDSLGMVQKHKAIVLEPKSNQIHIFDLQNHKKSELNFLFLFEESDQSNILTFSQTKLYCIVQNGLYNDNRLRLTYFSGNITSESQPIAVYESNTQWTYDYITRKGNEKSMVMWFKPRQDQQFQLKQFHIEDVNPKFNYYISPNKIGQSYGKQKLQIAISSAWQASKSNFCLVCITQKSNYNHDNNEVINNNFIWETTTNTIRETKFIFNPLYSQLLIDVHSFGKYSVFHTFSFHNGKAQASPIFYVDNEEQKLIPLQRQWFCTYKTKISFPSYQLNTYVESQYQNGQVNEFKVKIIRIYEKQN